MEAKNSIGVFDSGVGGLTVLHKLADLLPYENLIYLGDTARVPYGNKSPELICLYAQQCTRFLLANFVKLIIVACNTASAVALDAIRAISPVPVIGMIEPGANAAIHYTQNGNIGVIGTQATIQSKAYEKALYYLRPECNVHAKACPLFVPLAEEGWHNHLSAQMIASEYLQALQQAKIECLILGCTHYPLLKETIQNVLPHVPLIDSGEEAAIIAKALLLQSGYAAVENNKRSIHCYVTDLNLTFATIAERFLGVPFDLLKQVTIDELSCSSYIQPISQKLTKIIAI